MSAKPWSFALASLGVVILSIIAPFVTANENALDPNLAKNGSVIRYLFTDVTLDACRSTVRILGDGDEIAFGTVIDANGSIITKASELRGQIVCRLKDGRDLPAHVIAEYQPYDLALLQVDAADLTPVKWAAGDDPPVGRWAVTPGLHGAPLAVGIISVPRRAIPVEKAVLGVSIRDTTRGPIVKGVIAESGADKAGIEAGDRILTVAGKQIYSSEHLVEVVRGYEPGTLVKVVYERDTEEIEIEVTLGAPIPSLLHPNSNDDQIARELSRRRADFPAVLQHDSVLQPENCGGPLIDIKGRVIGLNIARAGRTGCYAIPAGEMPGIIAELKKASHAKVSTGVRE
ncbi:MAG: PDZ domain-containing protein [Planctomycetota bacterium]|nr:PDZ domain-containing protein [Planctomycetota bacterium]MDA1214749.1 PDZ domain-containing protein [Planctomycetota bacterium]